MALTVVMAIQIPKGFFPIQDTGVISAFAEAAQDTSPEEMMRLMQKMGEVIQRDPDVAAFALFTGSTGGAQTANTGRGFIVLKPRDERELNASQIIDRLRPQLAKVEGANLFLQPSQDITVGGRVARAQLSIHIAGLQHRGVDRVVAEDAGEDAYVAAARRRVQRPPGQCPAAKITINRDQASRFGISPQLIDDTLNDAFGQRQITQYFTQLKTYFVILEILPDQQRDIATLDRLYVKSPLTGGAVPLSSLVDVDRSKVGPLSIAHQGQFPAVTLSFNLQPNVALGQAVDAITQAAREIGMPSSVIATFQGNAQAFQSSLSSEPILIAAALVVVYIILGMLYESFIHPLTILSTLPSAGVGALLALERRPHGPVGDRHHRHHSADRHRQEERHHAGRFRHRGRA